MQSSCFINKNLDKFPKTRRCLEEAYESIEDFQVRRVRKAVSQIMKEGEPSAEWRVIRRAGLGSAYSEGVPEDIKKLLAMHS